jgi:chorismate mutase
MTPALELRALRGATTAGANTCEAIGEAVAELIDALLEHNGLEGTRLLSVTFSVTADLDACFPAAIARRRPDWDGVALLDCQQMAVTGDLPRCIRLLAHAWLEPGQAPIHPYLREASRLRPDRARTPRACGDPASSPADH